MLLSNEFVVSSDVDTVWKHLLDMEGVAECVPGAKIEEVLPPATYRGKIRLKIGPMTVEYRGDATLVEVDEDVHRATIQMKAREARGQGSALATVRNTLSSVPEGTHVRAETELEITGPQAQFGKGVLEDVGGRILEEFTERLERRIARESAPEAGGGDERRSEDNAHTPGSTTSAPPAHARHASDDDLTSEALDLNRVLMASMRSRLKRRAGVLGVAAVALAAVASVLAALRRLGRRRRRAVGGSSRAGHRR